jgi:hypothetical protein
MLGPTGIHVAEVLALGKLVIASLLLLSCFIFSAFGLVSTPEPGPSGDLPPPDGFPAAPDGSAEPVIGTIDFSPSVFNVHSGGKYVTVRLALSDGVPVSSVYIPSIRFMGTVYAETCFSDHETGADKTNAPHMVLKFLRADVAAVLAEGENTGIFVTGMLVDGTSLYASGVVTVVA